ncbi:unnamed protein product [Ixodes pacificus]
MALVERVRPAFDGCSGDKGKTTLTPHSHWRLSRIRKAVANAVA